MMTPSNLCLITKSLFTTSLYYFLVFGNQY